MLATILISDARLLENYIYIVFLISPIFLNISLIFISGLKLLEQKERSKLKEKVGYQNYIKKTRMIIPYIGKKSKISILKNKEGKIRITWKLEQHGMVGVNLK